MKSNKKYVVSMDKKMIKLVWQEERKYKLSYQVKNKF